jgi:hypothetical protein
LALEPEAIGVTADGAAAVLKSTVKREKESEDEEVR